MSEDRENTKEETSKEEDQEQDKEQNQDEAGNQLVLWADSLKTKLVEIVSSWKFKLGAIASVLVAVFLVVFFWQHSIAVVGMKSWSARSGAQPIECMMKDTNDDSYVSCSAILKEEVIPLECGASILNIGCRVNYGAAPPVARQSQPKS